MDELITEISKCETYILHKTELESMATIASFKCNTPDSLELMPAAHLGAIMCYAAKCGVFDEV
jgi:hypothetical protein